MSDYSTEYDIIYLRCEMCDEIVANLIVETENKYLVREVEIQEYAYAGTSPICVGCALALKKV